jgi:hypothetical protein
MNERILELARQAGLKKPHASDTEYIGNFDWREFAELMVKEHLRIMQQEWYDINNEPIDPTSESPRDVGLRVGRKSEIIVLMHKVKKHFGVEE